MLRPRTSNAFDLAGVGRIFNEILCRDHSIYIYDLDTKKVLEAYKSVDFKEGDDPQVAAAKCVSVYLGLIKA